MASPSPGHDFTRIPISSDLQAEAVEEDTPAPDAAPEAEPVSAAQQAQPANRFFALPTRFRQRPRLLTQELRRPEIIDEPPPLFVVDEAVRQLRLALDNYTGTPQLAEVWGYVVAQVKKPSSKPLKKGAPPELYTPAVAAALDALAQDKKLKPGRQAQVLQRVFTHLLTATEKRLGNKTDGIGNPEQEYGDLNAATKKQIGSLGTYKDMRGALLAKFEALSIGTAAALKKINNYYQEKIVLVTFLGHKAWVHKELARALGRAEKLLTESEQVAIGKEVTDFGGVSVRPNTNNPLNLSEHSFGAAIDINPELNPNVPNFPVQFIGEVTGRDLLTAEGGRPKTDVFDLGKIWESLGFGEKDPALRELERLLGISKQLTGIFKDDASLATGMLAVAKRKTEVPAAVRPEALLAAAREARAEGTKVRWMYQDPKLKVPKNSAQGEKHNALVALVFPPGPGYLHPEPADEWETKRHAAELLIKMVDVYERSFAKDKKGAPVLRGGVPSRIAPEARAPEGEGALPQLVAHGFVNLPAKLVSVLRAPAPDGGDLRWLGASEHTKDSMHFELKQTPPLE